MTIPEIFIWPIAISLSRRIYHCIGPVPTDFLIHICHSVITVAVENGIAVYIVRVTTNERRAVGGLTKAVLIAVRVKYLVVTVLVDCCSCKRTQSDSVEPSCKAKPTGWKLQRRSKGASSLKWTCWTLASKIWGDKISEPTMRIPFLLPLTSSLCIHVGAASTSGHCILYINKLFVLC